MSSTTLRYRINRANDLKLMLAEARTLEPEGSERVTELVQDYDKAWAELHTRAVADLEAALKVVGAGLAVRRTLVRSKAADDQLSPELYEAAQRSASEAYHDFITALEEFEGMP